MPHRHELVQDCFTNADARAVVRRVVLDTIDMFGVGRCMFASNFPVDKLPGESLRQVYDLMYEFVAHMPEADLLSLFYANAARVYKLLA